MPEPLAHLEQRLDDHDPAVRAEAVAALAEAVADGRAAVPPEGDRVNLHCHSFYSYCGYGLSPSGIVWAARKLGLRAVGLVDFDVLDGVDEFHRAGSVLGVRTVAGLETRAFVPPFAAREINSPGEPGVAYHMVSGLVRSAVPEEVRPVADDLRARAAARTRDVLAKVDAHLAPVHVDFERDVVPLTPAGNATERHLCAAFQRRAEEVIPDRDRRIAFWAERLGEERARIEAAIDDAVALQALIRARTMKRGGVGYQQPERDTFPEFHTIDRFAEALGGIPTLAWLDGLSEGERAIEELLDLHMADGVAAVNIIPDRNWNVADPALKERKLAELRRIVRLADERGLPIQVGTELNAPGLPLVDDFDAPELADLVGSFRRGADIIFGHTVETLRGNHGYCSAWAHSAFTSVQAKNDHFARIGREHGPLTTELLDGAASSGAAP